VYGKSTARIPVQVNNRVRPCLDAVADIELHDHFPGCLPEDDIHGLLPFNGLELDGVVVKADIHLQRLQLLGDAVERFGSLDPAVEGIDPPC
jgi:hypothetical protein